MVYEETIPPGVAGGLSPWLFVGKIPEFARLSQYLAKLRGAPQF